VVVLGWAGWQDTVLPMFLCFYVWIVLIYPYCLYTVYRVRSPRHGTARYTMSTTTMTFTAARTTSTPSNRPAHRAR
jgi:hypothetical protein